jgi:hypothetical protein
VALTRIDWLPGFDFDRHLIRDFPDWPGFGDSILVVDDDPAIGQYVLTARPPGSDIASVVFTPRFLGAPSNHGVTVDTATGEITLDPAPAPTPSLNNFLLEVEVTHTSSTFPSPWREGLRIHVHDTLQGFVLTPDPLVGRQGSRSVRFAVYCLFSDDVMGEITDWTTVFAPDPTTGTPVRLLQYASSDTAHVAIEPDTQSIQFVSPGPATITVDFLGTPSGKSAAAVCEPPWSTPFEAKLVDGPGEDVRDVVRNILFLPDGFLDTEKAAFESLVVDLVRNGLGRNPFLAPYNHLSGSINYWSCFVPSPSQGVSVLSEVGRLRATSTGTLRGQALDPPSRPSPTATQWTLEELVHQVGLPLKTQAALARAALVSDWQKLYDPAITEAIVSGPHEKLGGGTVEAWTAWRELGLRVLVNEISTAFGLAIGGRHSADCVGGFDRALTPNGKRLDIADFDTFLRNLFFKDPAGGTDVTFGALWAPLEELPAKPRGKDVRLVCIIARTPYWAGTNVGWLYAAGLGEEREHRMMVGLGFDVEPMRLTARAPVILAAIVAHESAHSFGCGDEYAGDCSHGQPRDTSDTGNTQLATENGLQSAPPAIDVTKIKWQWPRIAKAGVLRSDATAPDPAHPEILKLELSPGHSAFTDGPSPDVLRLRARPLVSNPRASKLLKVTAVLRDPVNGDTLTVEQVEGFPPAIDLTPFVARSLVFAPALPGTAPAVDGTLVHPDVLAHIGTTNGPLNAPAGSPTRDCAIDFASQPKPHLYNIQIPTNLPPSMKTGTRVQPTWGSWIVGLYEGGAGFPCGIFHPTGACAMRSFAVPRKTLGGARIVEGFDTQGRHIPPPGSLYKFCAVCRYVLVDTVDPHKHPTIEAEYARIFPR